MMMYLPPPVHHSPLVTVLKHIFSNGDYYGATLYLAGRSVTLDSSVFLLVSIAHANLFLLNHVLKGIHTYAYIYVHFSILSLHTLTLAILPHPHYTSTPSLHLTTGTPSCTTCCIAGISDLS